MENNMFGDMLEKPKLIFAKNNGEPVDILDEYGKECSKILHSISIELIHNNFNSARNIIENSSIIKDGVTKYRDDISSIMFYVAKNEMTYKDFIGIAYESIIHENYTLFYAMINLIAYKLNTAQRMFFEDMSCIKDVLKKIDAKAGLTYPFIYEDVLEFKLFYKECLQNYYPVGNILKTKDDYIYKQNSKYSGPTGLNLVWVNNDFKSCIDEESMREFIIDVDNYINTIGNSNSSDMWNYLTDALLYDFLQSPFPWNEELSKSILVSMIGYSQCFDSNNIIEYTTNIRNFVLTKMLMIGKIIQLLPWAKKINNSMEVNIYQISVFLVNLYHVFPLHDLLKFINDKIINYDSNLLEFKDVKKHVLKLKEQGVKSNDLMIKFTHDIPNTSSVSEVFIYQQMDEPKYTTIHIGLNLAKASIVKIEFSFFDNNNQELILGRHQSDKFIIELGDDCPNGGYVAYHFTILNCSNISKVKARILNDSRYNTISTKNNPDSDSKKVVKHQNENGDLNSTKQEGCYIATAVYGSYNCTEVIILRKFRDHYMLKHNWGIKFVDLYYRYSPRYAKKLKNHTLLNSFIKHILDLFINKIIVRHIREHPIDA